MRDVAFGYHLKKLHGLLSKADDHAFLKLLWAVDALQTGREHLAAKLIAYPAEAAGARAGDEYAIHKWEIETLLVQLFLTPKQPGHRGRNRILYCTRFQTLGEVVNRLRKAENAEYALRNEPSDIFGEMHRIAQRQFHWQRGYYNLPQLYRYAYLYCQGKCAEYFQERNGFSIHDLTLTSFAVFATCHTSAFMRRNTSVEEVGLTGELLQRVLPLLSLPLAEVRARTAALTISMNKNHGSRLPVAYLPSILRQYPLISSGPAGDMLIAPLPELILLRMTAGLYYDLIGGGQSLLNEANDRFEQYCADLIDRTFATLDVRRSYRYGTRQEPIDSPDILISDAGSLVIVAECKATKLTYLAQFADDPFEAQHKQYRQLAEGVAQIWRYFSHARRGLANESIAAEAYGLVITLDTFLSFQRELKAKVLELASTIASEDPEFMEEDKRHVMFCPVQDLESIAGRGTKETLLGALKASLDKQFLGWQLREIHRDMTRNTTRPRNKYPFDMDDVLPWWRTLEDRIDPDDEVAIDEVDSE